MAISLSSISQLSALLATAAETNFLKKYESIFKDNVTANIEISYKIGNNTLSLKLDIKDALKTLYTDLCCLMYNISANLHALIESFMTQSTADNRYVLKSSATKQFIDSNLEFKRQLDFKGNLIIANNVTTNIGSNSTVTLNGANLIVKRLSSTSGNIGGNITTYTLSSTNDTYCDGNLLVGKNSEIKGITVHGNIYAKNSSNANKVTIEPNNDNTILTVNGNAKVTGKADLSAEHAKWS